MEKKEYVKKKYPKAEAKLIMMVHDQSTEYHIINGKPWNIIGSGKTEKDAWENAGRKITKKTK